MSATTWLRIKARAGQVLLAGLALSVVASVIWYRRLAIDTPQPAPAALPANNSAAEMVTRDFRHVETRMDRTIWVLESARAEIFGEEWANLHEVKITWYGEPGDIPIVITSAKGDVDFRDRSAVLHGDVRAERADGLVLRTEQLLWNDATKLLRAPFPVVITTPTLTFQGDSLDAFLASDRITLRGRVRGEIRGGPPKKARPS